MTEVEAPGDPTSSSFTTLVSHDSSANISIAQVELAEGEEEAPHFNDASVLDKLAEYPYQVFVLSEFGRPIFVSCGYEEQLCSLFALIGVFVSRVKSWGDQLQSISSGSIHVHFSFRSPLVLCIVSRTAELLPDQLSVVFDQILSTLSKPQLENIYKKRGDNYDLRRLLKGTDKFMSSCVSAWRGDVSLFHSAIRVAYMNPSDRDFLMTTMATCMGASKLEGALFALMVANRQVVAQVHQKKYVMHPRDTHILINLVSDNQSMQMSEAQTWTPICLPYFNDTGFFYAHITYPWDKCPACLILLTVKRDHFEALSEVKRSIVEKLEANTKFFASFQTVLSKPTAFNIPQIGTGFEQLWSFVYKNRSSRQICISSAREPIISQDERTDVRRAFEKATDLTKREAHMKLLIVRRPSDTLYIWVTDRYELQCIFSPFVSASAMTAILDKLLKSLKVHEHSFFIIHSTSF